VPTRVVTHSQDVEKFCIILASDQCEMLGRSSDAFIATWFIVDGTRFYAWDPHKYDEESSLSVACDYDNYTDLCDELVKPRPFLHDAPAFTMQHRAYVWVFGRISDDRLEVL